MIICLIPKITFFHNGLLRCFIKKGYQVYAFIFGNNDDNSKIIFELGDKLHLSQVTRMLFIDTNQPFKQKVNI